MTAMFLWEMAWKSSLLIVAALAVTALLRGRSAADRAFVLRLAVGLLLMLPVGALLGPDFRVEQPRLFPAWVQPVVPDPIHPRAASPLELPAGTVSRPSGAAPSVFTLPMVLLAGYGLGVGAVLSHLLAGLMTLRRWTVEARPVWHPLWAAAYDRARLRSGVRADVPLLSSADIPETMGWGLRRPVILIDPRTLARDEQAEAVLGHEMAHVARRDWLALLLGRLMLALFWFNPLAWLLNRRMLEEAEAAADMTAVARLDPAFYAQTLLAHALSPRLLALPATPMAGSSALGRRIGAVLDARTRSRASGSGWTGLACVALLGCGGLIAVVDLLPARPAQAAVPAVRQMTVPTESVAQPEVAGDPADASDLGASPGTVAEPAAGAAAAWEVPPSPRAPAPPAPPAAPAPPEPAPARVAPPAPPAPPEHPDLAEFDREGMHGLGVTDQWVADMAAALALPRLDRHDAVGLKAMGMTPAKVRDLRAAGVKGLTADCALELAALGVTPEFVRDMAAAGYPGLSSDALVELKAVGVTRAFAERARRDGRASTVDELVELRVIGHLF